MCVYLHNVLSTVAIVGMLVLVQHLNKYSIFILEKISPDRLLFCDMRSRKNLLQRENVFHRQQYFALSSSLLKAFSSRFAAATARLLLSSSQYECLQGK